MKGENHSKNGLNLKDFKMKARHFLLAILMVVGLSSCAAELITPADEMSAKNVLEKEYNALRLQAADPQFAALPVITLNEAKDILNSLRSHKNAKEELTVNTHDEGQAHVWELLMKQIIDNKYTFAIQLNITSFDDGSLFYNGYNTECSSSKIAWDVNGFSFESDKTDAANFRFKSNSNIFLNVAADEGNSAVYKIDVAIDGNYHSDTQTSSYSYTL